MIAPAHLLPLEWLLSYLPCAGCSAPGPHRVNPTRKGGFIALCEPCREIVEAEEAQGPLNDRPHMLHLYASAGVAA